MARFHNLGQRFLVYGDYDSYREHLVACKKVGHCTLYSGRYRAKIGQFWPILEHLVARFHNLGQRFVLYVDYDPYRQHLFAYKNVGHCALYLGRYRAKIGQFWPIWEYLVAHLHNLGQRFVVYGDYDPYR